jgi:hypothetical protein
MDNHVKGQQEGCHLLAKKETNYASISIFNFQHLECKENKFLRFKLPNLWYLIMAALANLYTHWNDENLLKAESMNRNIHKTKKHISEAFQEDRKIMKLKSQKT